MSAPTIPSVADLLRGALAELRRPLRPGPSYGWTQGTYGTRDTCKCAAGAIYAAANVDASIIFRFPHSDVRAAFLMLAKAAGYSGAGEGRLISWNDDSERTFPEVEAVFERAIELAEAGAR